MKHKILIFCGESILDTSISWRILKFLKKKRYLEYSKICLLTKDEKIIKFLKDNKISYTNSFKKVILNTKKNEFNFLLNLWGNYIFKKDFLKKFKNSMNIHPSYLPFSKGRDPYVWSIYNEFSLGFTFHEISEQIDEGKVFLKRKIKFKRPLKGFELYVYLCKEIEKEFKKSFSKILANKIKPKKNKKSFLKTNKRSDLIKFSKLNLDNKKFNRERRFFLRIMALDFPKRKLKIQYNKKNYLITLNLI